MRLRTSVLGILALAAFAVLASAPACRPPDLDDPGTGIAALAPLPPAWPSSRLEIGQADGPGGAAAMNPNFEFRYQYLAGGVNTGNGWSTWNTNGQFVTYYIQDSVAAGKTPAFSYYMIYQSNPGASQGEADGVYNNLQNTSTMTAYYNDLKLFFQRAGAFSSPVVLHVEPDLWGYLEQRASNDNATTVPAKVAATGLSELAGLPNNVAGLSAAIDRLRDQYAPNVILGYHMSIWGTGADIIWSNSSNDEVDALATEAANWFNSLGGGWDVTFGEFTDRDAAFKQANYGPGEWWWDNADFARHARFVGKFTTLAARRMVIWQIPYGNTKMRAMNNTWGHYQDNHVEWLLDEPARTHLNDYLNNGVIAFWFGGGAGGVTCPCDAMGDGTTNPAPINGNTLTSLSADDDGGFFDQKAAVYYSTGAITLPGATPPDIGIPANETITPLGP